MSALGPRDAAVTTTMPHQRRRQLYSHRAQVQRRGRHAGRQQRRPMSAVVSSRTSGDVGMMTGRSGGEGGGRRRKGEAGGGGTTRRIFRPASSGGGKTGARRTRGAKFKFQYTKVKTPSLVIS